MDQERANRINILTSKVIDPRSADFNSLLPPCRLYDLLSPYDIEILRYTATSSKLSDRPKEKRQIIKDIMEARGFKKIAGGTNRIVFKYAENQQIVLKVAYDKVAMKDNPSEMINQHYLQPFVDKIFEISPCGTVAMCERVNAITNIAQFASVSDDIFDVICHFVYTRGYVLDDFGSNYFMNWGVCARGPVLLDYPYMYELDGSKLFCISPDKSTISGVCDGEIDYDAGFNKLVCKKCGKVYLASDLKKKNNQSTITTKGGQRMNVKLVKFHKDGTRETVVNAKKMAAQANSYGKPNRKKVDDEEPSTGGGVLRVRLSNTPINPIIPPDIAEKIKNELEQSVAAVIEPVEAAKESETTQPEYSSENFNDNTSVEDVDKIDKLYQNPEIVEAEEDEEYSEARKLVVIDDDTEDGITDEY